MPRRRLLDALLAQEQARIFCSHTGVAALGPRWRNLDDAALRRIAERGGVVGIIFGTPYLGSRRLEAVADHIEHAVRVAGEEAVCLGSDFDGMVPLPTGMRDVTDLWKLTALLLGRGHPRSRIERILGLNLRRFLADVLGDIERRRVASAGHDDRARGPEPRVDQAPGSTPTNVRGRLEPPLTSSPRPAPGRRGTARWRSVCRRSSRSGDRPGTRTGGSPPSRPGAARGSGSAGGARGREASRRARGRPRRGHAWPRACRAAPSSVRCSLHCLWSCGCRVRWTSPSGSATQPAGSRPAW